jgi:hypothetical protein
MIGIEMPGYYCHEPGCRQYQFRLMFMNGRKAGNSIGIAGNSRPRELTRSLERASRKNPGLARVTLAVPLIHRRQ